MPAVPGLDISDAPFSSFPSGTPESARRSRSKSPGGSQSARARSASPGSPRQTIGFGSSTLSARKKPMNPSDFFHASMRGGPLTEPMPHRGLTARERRYPEEIGMRYAGKGGVPTLLFRDKFGARKSEWERYKSLANSPDGSMGGNFLEDDNPFNDPFKYHPFKGMAFPPGNYIGPDDPRETDDMSRLQPGNALRLEFVYGCARARFSHFYYSFACF